MLSFLKPLHYPAVRNSLSSISVIAVLILFQNVCIAQTKAQPSKPKPSTGKFELGIAGGISLNNFTHGQPQTGSNTGYTAGLSVNYRFYKELSVQVEANFLQQGGQLLTFKDDTRYGLPENFLTKNVKNSSISLNGLEIPLLVKYNFKLKQTWKPALYVGGSYIYNYNATDHYQKTGDLLPGEDVIATVSDHQNVTSQYNESRLNFIVGANVHLPLFDNIKLLIDFRYLTGLSPARENYSYMEKAGFGSDIRANSFISKIGLIMPLK
jgi:hypothetical protein